MNTISELSEGDENIFSNSITLIQLKDELEKLLPKDYIKIDEWVSIVSCYELDSPILGLEENWDQDRTCVMYEFKLKGFLIRLELPNVENMLEGNLANSQITASMFKNTESAGLLDYKNCTKYSIFDFYNELTYTNSLDFIIYSEGVEFKHKGFFRDEEIKERVKPIKINSIEPQDLWAN